MAFEIGEYKDENGGKPLLNEQIHCMRLGSGTSVNISKFDRSLIRQGFYFPEAFPLRLGLGFVEILHISSFSFKYTFDWRWFIYAVCVIEAILNF